MISTILKHDSKQTSYKIALLRAINDVVLSFPDMRSLGLPVAIPLRLLAEFWLAYYWPFVDPTAPILQGPRAQRTGLVSNDMAFRSDLTTFRRVWQEHWGGLSSPSDGFFVINELRLPRIRAQQPEVILNAYRQALRRLANTLESPSSMRVLASGRSSTNPAVWPNQSPWRLFPELSSRIYAWL